MEVKRGGANSYVFPGVRPNRPLSQDALYKQVARAGDSVHGFRSELFRLAGSRKAGYSEEIVERALAHKVGSTVKRASRRDDDPGTAARADGVVGRLRRRGDAIYAPASAPPDSYVAGMKGLDAVTFPAGGEQAWYSSVNSAKGGSPWRD